MRNWANDNLLFTPGVFFIPGPAISSDSQRNIFGLENYVRNAGKPRAFVKNFSIGIVVTDCRLVADSSTGNSFRAANVIIGLCGSCTVGNVVEQLAPDVCEVEFSDQEGHTYAMVALPADQMMVLHYQPAKRFEACWHSSFGCVRLSLWSGDPPLHAVKHR